MVWFFEYNNNGDDDNNRSLNRSIDDIANRFSIQIIIDDDDEGDDNGNNFAYKMHVQIQ